MANMGEITVKVRVFEHSFRDDVWSAIQMAFRMSEIKGEYGPHFERAVGMIVDSYTQRLELVAIQNGLAATRGEPDAGSTG